MEKSPSVARRFLLAGVPAAAFLILDQIVKMWVRSDSSLVAGVPFLPGLLRLQFVRNTGAAFSIGEGHGYLFVVLAVAVVIACCVYLARAQEIAPLEAVGMGMVAGGAVGNAIDRLVFGFVTDFLATEFIDFPVFNIADIGITVGVMLAFIGFIFLSPAAQVDATEELNRRDRERKEKKRGGRSDR